ncbi:hypothetical protein YDYSG_67580 [Paenibacillus tyrfis]|uniref:hypothetical protein n=1 Tax=Paenibacillus tyrfis TaxID=1501230 RepID=UPI0024922F7C|nr:hypothetical protein [Paenibacillus tyrfis]GLI10722.1 hypothetical protein YDYSG_67580 [Paenibacillus tyrfis]
MNVVRVDFSDSSSIAAVICGYEIVYNCTADAKLHTVIDTEAEVEVKLTRRLSKRPLPKELNVLSS